MDFDNLKKALDVTPTEGDTSRTTGWKILLQTAQMCDKKGETEKAIEIYTRCLELCEKRLGADNVILAHILMQLARLHEQRGNDPESREFNGRAREIIAQYAFATMANH